jgi:hypothetical protein
MFPTTRRKSFRIPFTASQRAEYTQRAVELKMGLSELAFEALRLEPDDLLPEARNPNPSGKDQKEPKDAKGRESFG